MKQKEVAPAPTSLVASAARIRNGVGARLVKASNTSWHESAWEFYRSIGEFRYACDWIGGMLSKATIYGTVETVDGVERVTDTSIIETLSALFGNADGRAEMFRLIGIHMSVTGECYLVGYPDPDPFGDGGDIWTVAASTRVTRAEDGGGTWRVNGIALEGVAPDDVLCVRIWRPDPLDPENSISPARAILDTLRELYKMGQYVSAQIDSRLAGAGLLLMPDTMTLPPPPVVEGEDEPRARSANDAEELMTIIMEAMMASITDREHASSRVPIVVTAPADAIAAVKHMTFWSELDSHIMELRKEAIGRVALGMDVPPEVLQGASDSNHWSAWQADESAIKAHAEPLLKIITTALGSHYLRPILSDNPEFADVRLAAYSVAADTSEMRLRPNRSKEALELYNLGELSGVALRRETGFDETDAMAPEELALWLTRKVAAGSTTPEYVEAALRKLGVTLDVVVPAEPSGDTQEARPAPSLKDHPEQSPPDQGLSERRKQARDEGRVPSAGPERKASLLAASEQLVFRALERAGNRLKNKMGGLKINCPASELYTFASNSDPEELLIDAWGGVPLVAKRAQVEPESLELALAAYAGDLIENQRPHSYEEMDRYISMRIDLEVAVA